ncbi:unnamed protein product [Arctogadus glacialis]
MTLSSRRAVLKLGALEAAAGQDLVKKRDENKGRPGHYSVGFPMAQLPMAFQCAPPGRGSGRSPRAGRRRLYSTDRGTGGGDPSDPSGGPPAYVCL